LSECGLRRLSLAPLKTDSPFGGRRWPGSGRPRGPSPAPKQSRKKSALTLAPRFGALIEKCALLLSLFYRKAGADKLVNLIWDEQVTFAELSIDVIIWISIPNKTYDLKEHFTVPPEGGITCLQKDECSAAHSLIF